MESCLRHLCQRSRRLAMHHMLCISLGRRWAQSKGRLAVTKKPCASPLECSDAHENHMQKCAKLHAFATNMLQPQDMADYARLDDARQGHAGSSWRASSRSRGQWAPASLPSARLPGLSSTCE